MALLKIIKKIHKTMAGWRTYIVGVTLIVVGTKLNKDTVIAGGVAILTARYSITVKTKENGD